QVRRLPSHPPPRPSSPSFSRPEAPAIDRTCVFSRAFARRTPPACRLWSCSRLVLLPPSVRPMRYALLRFVPAALLVIGLVAPALSGCSGSRPPAPEPELDLTDPDLPVATYADEALTLSEFEDAYATAVGGRTTAANDSLGAYQDFLERYVNFRLKVRQAYEIGLDQDSALQAEMASYRDQLARPYFTDQAVLDAIVRDLYEKQKEEISAAHILVQVAEDAPAADTLAAYEKITALRDSIEAGMPFDEVAFRHSEDPSARRNRGDLGYFTGGRMIEPFENAAYATPVGEIAGP